MLSLGELDADVAIGEGGGSSRPVIERHVQTEIRAVVSPWPYSEVAHT